MPSVDSLRPAPGGPAAAGAVVGGPRSALIIATARYKDPQLRRLRVPVHGADGLATALGSPAAGGFTVTALADGTDSEIRLGVASFLAGRGAAETVLVYLACHAIRDRARLYFAAGNTVLRYPSGSAVPAEWVVQELDRCGAGRRALILDCCTIGGFAVDGDDLDLEGDLGLHGRGIAVLAASGTREYSYEGRPVGRELIRPAFTVGLAEGLVTGAADMDDDGIITLTEAFDYASRYVRENGPGQAPEYYPDGLHGEFVLARTLDAPQTEQPVPEPALTAPVPAVDWFSPAPAAVVPSAAVSPGYARAVPCQPRGHHAAAEPASGRARREHPSGVVPLPNPSRSANPGPAILEQDRDDAYCVAFSPDGKLLASGGWRRPVRIRDIAAGGAPRELRAAGVSAYDLAFSPDGTLLASGGRDGTVTICEVADGRKARARKPSAAAVRALAFSPKGGLLASAHEDGTARLWETPSLGKPRELKAGRETIFGIAFSPDGTLLAAACGDGAIRVWRAVDGSLVAAVKCHIGWATGVVFTPDGTLLASAGADGSVLLHDALTGAQAGVLRSGHGIVNAIALTPDGALLAAARETGTVTVWHLGTGEDEPLPGHAGFVNDVTFSPDGRMLASAGKDGTVRLWR
jgi:WD40 repeat protein